MPGMRNPALVLVFAAACGGGGNKNEKKDGSITPPIDSGPLIDAPALIGCTPVSGTTVTVRMIGQVSGSAVLATSPPNDGRLFVIEQQGRIRVFENEMLKTEAYLDVSALASGGTPPNEQGLLGLAFHPDFGNNRQFYIYYTTNNANIVAKYTQSATDPNKADPTGEIILSIPDFASNHNGGMIEFGKDGYLYIGTGDGGGGGDPCRNAQAIDRTAATCTAPPASCAQSGGTVCEPLLGKILRIDVNTTSGSKKYGIPSDNPYAAGGGEPEIFIRGVRNPWRWSFDRTTGDLYIGDVGQGAQEEVTVVKAGEQNGKNLGWSMYEGTACYGNYTCSQTGMTAPQVTRSSGGQDNWHSVIGGEVYRGECFPDLKGYYFFTDYAARPLVRGKLEANGTLTTSNLTLPATWPTGPTSIHGDARGELFLTNTQGRVYQIEATP
jgi:glucose/arabinose dehydrogenase